MGATGGGASERGLEAVFRDLGLYSQGYRGAFWKDSFVAVWRTVGFVEGRVERTIAHFSAVMTKTGSRSPRCLREETKIRI